MLAAIGLRLKVNSKDLLFEDASSLRLSLIENRRIGYFCARFLKRI